jgi:phage baseplate assembly protein W
MKQEFVGQGWAFPVHVVAGGVALVSGAQEIEQSIRLIIETAPGERPMRPEFGCAIHDFVFAGTDARTLGRIAHEIRAALTRWEPRIEVADVSVGPDADEAAELLIEIAYIIRSSNDPRNLVFPFYVIPSEDELGAPSEELERL